MKWITVGKYRIRSRHISFFEFENRGATRPSLSIATEYRHYITFFGEDALELLWAGREMGAIGVEEFEDWDTIFKTDIKRHAESQPRTGLTVSNSTNSVAGGLHAKC